MGVATRASADTTTQPTASTRPDGTCISTSDIVGYDPCERFGAGWDLSGWPHLFGVLPGWGLRSFDTSTIHLSTPFSPALRTSTQQQPGGSIVALQGLTLELGFPLPYRFYVAGAFFGSLGDPPQRVRIDGTVVAATAAQTVAGGVLLGRRFGGGLFQLRTEILVGGGYDSISDGSYDSSGDLLGATYQAERGYGLIEPRVGVDWYLLPQWSLDATLGVPSANPLLPSASLNLEWHLFSYDH